MTPAAWALLLRIGMALVFFASVFFIGKLVYDSIYNRGVAAENARWMVLQAEADKQAHAKEQGDTKASETIADTARDEAAKAVTDTSTQTEASVARIEYVYLQSPAPKCPADGSTRPVPAGVLAELDAAVAAVATAAAPAR